MIAPFLGPSAGLMLARQPGRPRMTIIAQAGDRGRRANGRLGVIASMTASSRYRYGPETQAADVRLPDAPWPVMRRKDARGSLNLHARECQPNTYCRRRQMGHGLIGAFSKSTEVIKPPVLSEESDRADVSSQLGER